MSDRSSSSPLDESVGSRPRQYSDTTDSYGWVSRFNHWLGAALVLTLLGIGLYFEDMPKGPDKLYWLKLHISIGALALLLLAFRVGWRLGSTRPRPFPQPTALRYLTHAVHAILLLGIAILIVSGPFAVWTGGRAIEVFDWFALPSPTGEMHELHALLETLHVVTAKVVLVAIIVHVLGAAKHIFFDQTELGRMIGRAGGRSLH